ncbi:hypothetical protein JZ751_021660 [Albula glossodonta]|uniref:Uncharacterized protein n=1 Tax=Albula glossodonta TaxID=121402 RepID=A0A8T2NLX3_9TELE|nr:hypothetical protein JZ751_021660 [Albula glossodonta]
MREEEEATADRHLLKASSEMQLRRILHQHTLNVILHLRLLDFLQHWDFGDVSIRAYGLHRGLKPDLPSPVRRGLKGEFAVTNPSPPFAGEAAAERLIGLSVEGTGAPRHD